MVSTHTPISFMPMFNAFGFLDIILAGDGVRSRMFRRSKEVRAALQQAGVGVSAVNSDIDLLDDGYICEVWVTAAQKERFFKMAGGLTFSGV
jgi:hypothetical protein